MRVLSSGCMLRPCLSEALPNPLRTAIAAIHSLRGRPILCVPSLLPP